MPQDNCQKIKQSKLMEILRRETDEEHPLKTAELCERLREMRIFWRFYPEPNRCNGETASLLRA